MPSKRVISTTHGEVRFPTFVPVTTFGAKYPLDNLIRPYLPRLSQIVMVSYFYARQMKKEERPCLPLMVDSGGFASFFDKAKIVEEGDLGILEIQEEEETIRIHPKEVLDFQENVADIAFPLDFPIPPSLEKDKEEAERRLSLTIKNALWALENKRRKDLLLFAPIQAWDEESARRCTKCYVDKGFDGFALGGMVPRLRDFKKVLSIVKAVREGIGDGILHVFGIGKPELIKALFLQGVDSVDSSSYVKLAAQGKQWGEVQPFSLDPSPTERLQLALCNLAQATGMALPLSAYRMAFAVDIRQPFRT